jgi:putative transposase
MGTVPLSEIVRQLKTFSARRINQKRGTQGQCVWQRNYWKHIIRNENEMDRIRNYVINNPVHWNSDKLHPHWNEKSSASMEICEPSSGYSLESWMV